MRTLIYYLFLSLLFFNCTTEEDLESSGSDIEFGESIFSDSGGTDDGPNNDQSGLVTAAEWNDLEHWDFWNALIINQEFDDKPGYWNFYNNNRVSFLITTNNEPVVDSHLQLLKNGSLVWESKTDNSGSAEMWIDLFQNNSSVQIEEYSLKIDGEIINTSLRVYEDGINEIEFNSNKGISEQVELSFIVDATGSMSDELEFLKDDLASVIETVKSDNSLLSIYTSSVFYRDEGDDYITKKSDFSSNLNTTLSFINDQSAAGGGNFPEAVHSAMNVAINELQWSENARTRIAFLLLDAPPHHENHIISDLQNSIKEAAKKGIKVIPITASGIDKETEFLMRFFSLSTNGTYVFITNDSGIGNDHIEASVGEYQVELLNELMIRLIKKYTEHHLTSN